jgi:hypothetical protein
VTTHSCDKCVVCDKCGERYCIGDSPVCKGGHKRPHEHRPFRPYWDEHIAEDPVLVTSHHHRKQLLKQAGLEFRGRKRGMPGQEI